MNFLMPRIAHACIPLPPRPDTLIEKTALANANMADPRFWVFTAIMLAIFAACFIGLFFLKKRRTWNNLLRIILGIILIILMYQIVILYMHIVDLLSDVHAAIPCMMIPSRYEMFAYQLVDLFGLQALPLYR